MNSQEPFKINNIDLTVIAQKPYLSTFKNAMLINLMGDLNIEREQVNIKATTTEGLGFVGREEGIAVHALVLISRVVD